MSANQFLIIRPVAVADSGAFTRTGANATYYESDGYRDTVAADVPRFAYDPVTLEPTGLMMEAAATNLCLRSNDMSNAAWTKTSATGGAPSVSGADGTNSLGLLTSAAAASSHRISQTATVVASTPYSASVDVQYKPSNLVTHVQIFVDDNAGNGAYANFDMVNGVFTVDATAVGTGIVGAAVAEELMDGIWRISLAATHASTTGRWGIALVDPADSSMGFLGSWTGTVAEILHAGSFQYEAGSVATSYIGHTSGSAIARGADVNTLKMVSNVPEPATGADPDPAAWNGATAYTAGQQVTLLARHEIYQRLTNGTTATSPELDTTNWVLVGATNRWKLFDATYQSQTTNNRAIQLVLNPGALVDILALDNLDADYVRVFVEGTSYDQTVQLKYRPCTNWFQYFFEPFIYKKSAVFSGLPLLTTNKINVLIYKAGSVAKAGYCIHGLSRALGYAEPGASVGIIDYSKKETDQFGQTTVVVRPYSKRMNISVIIQNTDLDSVQELLAEYRATPVVWLGASSLYSALIIYGYYRSFDTVIAYPTQSRCNLEIEGLT